MPNLSLSNLLETHPSTDFTYAPYAFGVLIFLFIASFIVSIFRKRCKNSSLSKALRSLPGIMRILSGVLLLMTWSRIEGLPYISMRIFWIFIFFFMLYIIYRVLKKYKTINKTKQHFEGVAKDYDVIKKYLPKKNKNKK